MSGTTSCRPWAEPGGASTGPAGVWLRVVSAIEHAEPGGVSCTMRTPPPASVSKSTVKPSCSP
jgi:hypothetical protein